MTSYPITIHTRGTTYSRAGLYTLPSGTWSATATVSTSAGATVQTLDVNLSALGTPDADGHTHALSVLATATETALWPLAALLCDIRFTDASATPVVVPADTVVINVSAHTPPVSEADNPLQVISGDMAPVLRGEQGPAGAASTVPGPTGPAGPGVPTGGTTGQVLAKASATDHDTAWVDQTGGGGTGATNLGYTASATGGTVTSDTGTDAAIPLADSTTAGLLSPAQNSKLAGIATGATAVTVDATPTDGSANAVASNGVFDALASKSDTGHTHTGTYDPAGTAASAVVAHASALDPHGDRAFAAAADAAVASAAAADATSKANAAAAASTPAAHAGAGGTAHANAVAGGAAGFISGADQSKLDGIAAGAQVNPSNTDALTEGSTNLYHTAARVRAAVLTGLSTAAATVVDATHTVLQAIGFLQKQVSDNTTAISGKASTGAIGSSGLTMATAKLLGRSTASTGAVEELAIGSGLTLSAGTLSASGGGSFDPAAPGPIGGTTPSTIAVTGVTVTGGTVTSSTPVINATQTWNNASVTFVGKVTDITSTASAAASLIEDWRVGGVSKACIRKDGAYGTQDAWMLGSTYGGHPALGYYRTTSETAPRVVLSIFGVQVTGASGKGFTWSSTDPSAATSSDTGLMRNAAGVVEVTNGNQNTYRDLKLRNFLGTGNLATGIAAKTSSYTLTANDGTVTADATSGAITLTLPAVSGCNGRIYVLKRLNSGANAVTVAANAAETIDGANTVTLGSQYSTLIIQGNADGTAWFKLAAI